MGYKGYKRRPRNTRLMADDIVKLATGRLHIFNSIRIFHLCVVKYMRNYIIRLDLARFANYWSPITLFIFANCEQIPAV